MKNRMDAEYIRQKVETAMGYSLESFNFENIIDCTELSEEDKEWAKQNLSWGVFFNEDADIWSSAKAVANAKAEASNNFNSETRKNIDALWRD